MNINWFNDRPLHLETVCTRLREAVEERENFFGFNPEKCATMPLELPAKPYRSGNRGSYPLVSGLAEFADNLSSRISALANFSYPPDNLGKFSKFYQTPARGGWEYTGMDDTVLGTILDFCGVEPADFNMHKPFRFADMRFFNACAKILNCYVRYPKPPNFNSSGGTVFSWNYDIDLDDLDNGTHISHNYAQDGAIAYRSSRGTYRTVDANRIAEWIKYDLKIRTSNFRFYYDTANGSDKDIPVNLSGNWQFEIPYVWSYSGSGVETMSETLPEVYTFFSGGSVAAPFPGSWQSRVDDVLDGNGESTSLLIQRNINNTAIKIKLDKENYPALPYKYLT